MSTKNELTIQTVLPVLIIIAVVVSGASLSYIMGLSSNFGELSADLGESSAELSADLGELSAKVDVLTSDESMRSSTLSDTVDDIGDALGEYGKGIISVNERLKSLEARISNLEEEAKPKPIPPKKVVLRIGMDRVPDGLGPGQNAASDFINAFMNHVQEPLFKMWYDKGQIVYQGVLVDKYDQPDKDTWIFHLKKGVKFNDGHELDSQDVYWSLTRDNPTPPSYGWSINKRIASISIVDDYTIKMTTVYPMNNLYAWLCQGWTTITSYDHWVESGQETTWPLEGAYPGTGPYMWADFEPYVYCKLTLNPEWRGDRPEITDIELYAIPDNTARVTALETGEVDYIWPAPQEALDTLRDKGFKIWNTPGAYVAQIQINVQHPPTDDIRVRQAMSYAIDYEELIAEVWGPATFRPRSLAPMRTIGYIDHPIYDYDPDKATALITEYADDLGLTLPIQMKMGMIVGWGIEKEVEVSPAIQAYFREVGIDLDVEAYERTAGRSVLYGARNEYLAAENKDDVVFPWNLHYRRWHADTMEAADDLMSLYYSDGGLNTAYYENAEFDELVKFALSNAPRDARTAAAKEAQIIIMEDAIGIPLQAHPIIGASVDGFSGLIVMPNGYDWYLDASLTG